MVHILGRPRGWFRTRKTSKGFRYRTVLTPAHMLFYRVTRKTIGFYLLIYVKMFVFVTHVASS